ncbi:unnamed protein product [Urochloa humidicola]
MLVHHRRLPPLSLHWRRGRRRLRDRHTRDGEDDYNAFTTSKANDLARPLKDVSITCKITSSYGPRPEGGGSGASVSTASTTEFAKSLGCASLMKAWRGMGKSVAAGIQYVLHPVSEEEAEYHDATEEHKGN